MQRVFVSPQQIGEKQVIIEGQDAHHICRVLRMKEGEELRVCTGQDDADYRCVLREVTPERVTADIAWVEERGTELPAEITLYQCLPKGDKMEWIIQKAVELGASRIVPVASERCIVKLPPGKQEGKLRRWNAISESAAKQSKRMIIPQVEGVISFSDAIAQAAAMDVVLFPYELADDMDHTRTVIGGLKEGQKIAVFIGPEGGFSGAEAELALTHGATSITLGRRILRTETAGMCVLSMLLLHLEHGKDRCLADRITAV